jgi:hypothetical protein
MWKSSSILTMDARTVFRIVRSIQPVVHCHEPVL